MGEALFVMIFCRTSAIKDPKGPLVGSLIFCFRLL
jgi:hypothetical protein